MNVEAFEDEIKDVLAAYLTQFSLDAVAKVVPDTLDEFDRPIDKAFLWVGYEDSDFASDKPMKLVAQDEMICFVVTIQAAKKRGEGGVYYYRNHVEAALLGYKPTNCTKKIWSEYFGRPKDGRPALIDGFWTYEYYFKTQGVLVQTIPAWDPNVIPPVPGLQVPVGIDATVTPAPGPYPTQ